MFRRRHNSSVKLLYRNRYADEWVGLLVFISVAVFVIAMAEAGVLKQWLTPEKTIHFVLPENGVAGLAVGNDIEVMGVRAGEIRRVDMNTTGRMYAEGEIEPQFAAFIRQDSQAIIRHRFVVAGASYIAITRGKGEDLDWGFAVLNAGVEPNPADVVAQTVTELRAQLVPALHNVQDITAQVDGMLLDLRAGKGSVGGLIAKDDTLNHVNQTLDDVHVLLSNMKPIEGKLSGVMDQAQHTLANARSTTNELRKAMPQIRQTIGHANDATAELPGMIVQAQATADSLRKLMDQLRGLWILGGHGTESNASDRLPAKVVRP
ncbi:ABC transporter periplasmic protein [Neokomagataea thailandica NBRC 106555]|uniref:MCE family protein n=2 Tax=Neokomagataea TaxID=1223423 RepID=A0A4Y6V4K1_9PROT|nr:MULTISPECIES: MlaD family protein [Neokomagataea]QDH24274.1 MCE family protein [Neokomagataea tanensis]GBR53005.1 ABC transporter periplasmic protein [Neokomagataea thailandica NBRC 106555]